MKTEHHNMHDHEHDKQHLPTKYSPHVNSIKLSFSTIELENVISLFFVFSQLSPLHQVEEKQPKNAIIKKY
jgi:hypothetical protein